MKFLVTLLFLALLTGCSGTVQTYQGEPRDISEIAIVRGGSNKPGMKEFWQTYKYTAGFVAYTHLEEGKKPEPVSVDNFSGGIMELHMAPGKYLLSMRCFNDRVTAFPSVAINAVAGMTYEVRCEPVVDNFGKVKASVVSMEKTPPKKKE